MGIRHSADSTSAVAAADIPAAEASGTRMVVGLGHIVAEGEKHRSSLVQRPVEESGGRRGRGPELGRKEVGRQVCCRTFSTVVWMGSSE